MLIRPDLLKVTATEDEAEIERLYRLAVEIRLRLPQHYKQRHDPKRPSFFSPGCHHVAHAFARMAGIAAVDGEHAFIKQLDPEHEDDDPCLHLTSILHSWTEFDAPSGIRFILDVFPDEDCPVFPLLYRAPHPAYSVPTDKKRLKALEQIHGKRIQSQIVELETLMRDVIAQMGSA